MPVITAQILKGRSAETKRRLASALTAAMADVLDLPLPTISVLITEFEKENWAIGGELLSDREPAPKPDDVLDIDALFKKPAPEKAKPASKPAAKPQLRKAPAKSRPRR